MVIASLWNSYHNSRYWVIDTPARIMNYKNALLNYYEDPSIETEGDPGEQVILAVLLILIKNMQSMLAIIRW
jgi:hypothetical protein